MSFRIIDTFTGKVLTTCETQAEAEKAETAWFMNLVKLDTKS